MPPSSAPQPQAFQRSASELLGSLELGWNLGNSLDAPENETAWGNPRVTPELLDGVARAGFDLVRIPVTWSLHTGPAPDYRIEPDWLDRVDEVVGYAEASGLYVVINLHHDGADGFEAVEWITLNAPDGSITEENNAAVAERFVAVWRQIAEHFKPHGEQLLFESMNEIHDEYGEPDPRYFEIVNELNQAFVDTVRQTGENNGLRHLVVPGYNTNIGYTVAGFELPQDTAAERLILSAHYYDPYLFTIAAETNTWGAASPESDGWGQEDFAEGQFDQLKTHFTDQGIPVLLGEYGAVNQAGFEDYRRYYMKYITKLAYDRGILPVYWDNGGQGSGGEEFGLLDRESGEPLHPPIVEAMRRAATGPYTLADIALPAQ